MGGGRHKLLLPLDGRPVLTHVIDALLASQARPLVIVLGHQADQVRAHIEALHPDSTIIENPAYLQGMSTSMHLGLQLLLSDGYKKAGSSYVVDSVLIVLGDQPMITSRRDRYLDYQVQDNWQTHCRASLRRQTWQSRALRREPFP